MGERKVLNKYFPPDFDPNLVPRTKFNQFKQIETRMMLPFNIQCETCGEFMYRGKKFNMRKEDVQGDTYKGIKKFRFYMKCLTCSREITFITDPEKMDYAMEVGAKRLFEVWKEQEKAEKEGEEKRAVEEQQDAMKALEHRTIDSKLEMDILDALEETKAWGNKRDLIRGDHLVGLFHQPVEGEEGGGGVEKEEEEEARKAFARARREGGGEGGLKKLEDSDGEGEEGKREGRGEGGLLVAGAAMGPKGGGGFKPVISIKAKKRKGEGEENGGKVEKKKKKEKEVERGGIPPAASAAPVASTIKVPPVRAATAPISGDGGNGGGGEGGGAAGLGGLMASYGSSSDED